MQTNIDDDQIMLAQNKLYQVGCVLLTIAETGDQIPHDPENETSLITPFHSSELPECTVDWFFVLLAMNSGIDEE